MEDVCICVRVSVMLQEIRYKPKGVKLSDDCILSMNGCMINLCMCLFMDFHSHRKKSTDNQANGGRKTEVQH